MILIARLADAVADHQEHRYQYPLRFFMNLGTLKKLAAEFGLTEDLDLSLSGSSVFGRKVFADSSLKDGEIRYEWNLINEGKVK